ncbi:FG-GAP repeat domain-containing protein [Streptomyces sp. NPDC101118]|uniref:FG-GAP repeat domain-containing protein n=1 Tax=Streptomyces sp. NPDC101118 TaxID=3366109 RepID=UPI0037F2DDE5
MTLPVRHARTHLGLALTPVLSLALAAPSALAAPAATTPPAAAAGTQVHPGPWAGQGAVAADTRVLDLEAAGDGTLAALLELKTPEGLSTVVSLRPVGSTHWSAPKPVRGGAGLTALPDGSVLLHWTEQDEQSPNTLIRTGRLASGGSGFGIPETIASVPAATDIVFAGDAKGRLAAAWQDDKRQLVVTERSAGGAAWTKPAVLDALPEPVERPDNTYEYRLRDLRLAVDATGAAMVIWGGNSKYQGDGVEDDPTAWKWHYKVVERAAGASAWSTPADLPQLGERPDGVVLAARPGGGFHWLTSGTYARRAAGATAWQPAEAVAWVGTNWRARPQLLALPNGDLMATSAPPGSSTYGATGTPGYAVRSAATGKWSTPQPFPSRYAVGGTLRATATPGGAVAVTWAQNNAQGLTDLKASVYAGGSWSAPTVLGTGIDRYRPGTELATDGTGRPVALWSRPTFSDEPYRYTTYGATTTARALPKWRDLSDDGRPDLIGVSRADTLRVFTGGPAGLAQAHHATWNQAVKVLPFGDLDGDRCNDLLVRLGTGEVRMYTPVCGGLPSEGSAYKRISSDWKAYDSLVAPGDLTGDGRPDLLARSSASGYLYLYPNNGRGGFGSRVLVGGGWNAYGKLVGSGDLNGDGKADLLARDGSGELWRYDGTGNGNGTGTFGKRALVFKDWGGSYTDVVGAGDLSGDGRADLVSRDTSGRAWLNPGNGTGGFGNRKQIGTTAVWKDYRPVS